MKRSIKLIICILSCLILVGCAGVGNNSPEENIFDGMKNVELARDDEYVLYYQKYDESRLNYYYEELFGVNNALSFIVQYEHQYLYKCKEEVDDSLIDKAYHCIKDNIDILKEDYGIEDLSLKENKTKEKCMISIENPNQFNVSVVVIELYIPFIARKLTNGKMYFFALPMKKYEFIKHDNLIHDFNNQEMEFNSFIDTYNIKLK